MYVYQFFFCTITAFNCLLAKPILCVFFFLLFAEADLVAAAATGGDAAFDALSAMRVGKNCFEFNPIDLIILFFFF